MFRTTFDKAIVKGQLVSVSRKGWLWFSKLCDIDYMDGASHAIVSYDAANDAVQVFPFSPPAYWRFQPDEFKIWAIEDNGVLVRVPWLRDMAAARGLYGQYVPQYDTEKRMISINLKERVKKYGR